MKEIHRNCEEMYTLYEDQHGSLHLSVLCGGIGMYELAFALSQEETEWFRSEGETYLTRLARKVVQQPDQYLDRR